MVLGAIGRGGTVNDTEREEWVMNYEPLHLAWKASRMSISAFVKMYRETIDAVAKVRLMKEPS